MGFHNLYSLNVFRARLEGVDNEALVKLCLEEAEDISKRKDQNPSGTGYEDSPIDPQHPTVKALREAIRRTIHKEIEPTAQEGEIWAHVLRPGESTQIHSHKNKKDWDHLGLSWVYYPQMVDRTKPDQGGKIVFQTHISSIKTISRDFAPNVGDFIIFPSWLSHFTTRHVGDTVRISISGNYNYRDEKLYNKVAHSRNTGIKKLTGF